MQKNIIKRIIKISITITKENTTQDDKNMFQKYYKTKIKNIIVR